MIYTINNNTAYNYSKYIARPKWIVDIFKKSTTNSQQVISACTKSNPCLRSRQTRNNTFNNSKTDRAPVSEEHKYLPLVITDKRSISAMVDYVPKKSIMKSRVGTTFECKELLCCTSDLAFFNLRGYFSNVLKAVHLCWIAARNNKRLMFVCSGGTNPTATYRGTTALPTDEAKAIMVHNVLLKQYVRETIPAISFYKNHDPNDITKSVFLSAVMANKHEANQFLSQQNNQLDQRTKTVISSDLPLKSEACTQRSKNVMHEKPHINRSSQGSDYAGSPVPVPTKEPFLCEARSQVPLLVNSKAKQVFHSSKISVFHKLARFLKQTASFRDPGLFGTWSRNEAGKVQHGSNESSKEKPHKPYVVTLRTHNLKQAAKLIKLNTLGLHAAARQTAYSVTPSSAFICNTKVAFKNIYNLLNILNEQTDSNMMKQTTSSHNQLVGQHRKAHLSFLQNNTCTHRFLIKSKSLGTARCRGSLGPLKKSIASSKQAVGCFTATAKPAVPATPFRDQYHQNILVRKSALTKQAQVKTRLILGVTRRSELVFCHKQRVFRQQEKFNKLKQLLTFNKKVISFSSSRYIDGVMTNHVSCSKHEKLHASIGFGTLLRPFRPQGQYRKNKKNNVKTIQQTTYGGLFNIQKQVLQLYNLQLNAPINKTFNSGLLEQQQPIQQFLAQQQSAWPKYNSLVRKKTCRNVFKTQLSRLCIKKSFANFKQGQSKKAKSTTVKSVAAFAFKSRRFRNQACSSRLQYMQRFYAKKTLHSMGPTKGLLHDSRNEKQAAQRSSSSSLVDKLFSHTRCVKHKQTATNRFAMQPFRPKRKKQFKSALTCGVNSSLSPLRSSRLSRAKTWQKAYNVRSYYTSLLHCNAFKHYDTFAKNPWLKQADLIFFFNAEQHKGLVNQAKRLQIPTIGIVSGSTTNSLGRPDYKGYCLDDCVHYPIIGNAHSIFFVATLLPILVKVFAKANITTYGN